MSSHTRQQQAVLVLRLLKVALSPWPHWNRRAWILSSPISSNSNIWVFFTRGWYGSKQLESNCFCVSNRAHNHNISAYCMYNFPLFAVLSFFHHCFFSPFSLVVIESNMGLSLSAAVLYSTVCCINDIHVDDKELLKAHVLPSWQTFLAWHKNTHVVT